MQASQVYPVSSKRNVIVTTVESTSYRYFNGRRYYTSQEMQHFLYPGDAGSDFWIHRIYVMCSPNWPLRASDHSTRYSTESGR